MCALPESQQIKRCGRQKIRENKRPYKEEKILRRMGSISGKQNVGVGVVSDTAYLAEQIRIEYPVHSEQCYSSYGNCSHCVEISCHARMSLLANFAEGADPDEKVRRWRSRSKVSLAAAGSVQWKVAVSNNIPRGPDSLRKEV